MPPERITSPIPIDSSTVTPNVRAKRFETAWRWTYAELQDALRDAEVIYRGGPETPISRLLEQLHNDMFAWVQCWQTRTRKAEAVLRELMASARLSDDERVTILQTMFGRPGARRDSRLLSEAERNLIDHYRQTDVAGRRMIREMFARLAASSNQRDADDDPVGVSAEAP
jgi:hypothetical protein